MSRYDGLIIPRSYSEYINKTDAATLQQALQLSGVLSGAVAAGDNKAVTSNAVNSALANLDKIRVNMLQDGGVDFNTVFVDADGEKATYFIHGSSTKPNSNAPMGLNTTNFILESVFSNGIVTQMAFHNEMQNLVYIRTRGYDSAWTQWEQLATKSELGKYNTNWIWYSEWIATRDDIENSAKGAGNYTVFNGNTKAGIEGSWSGYKHNGYGEGMIYTRYNIIGFSFSGDNFKYKIIMDLN